MLLVVGKRVSLSVEIWLPSEIGPHFFSDARVAALVATAGSLNRMTIIDWGVLKRSPVDFMKRFGETLEGLSSVVNAQSILSSRRESSSASAPDVLRQIEDSEGVLERKEGRTLTACAIDDVMVRQPLAFAPFNSKGDFQEYLVQKIRSAFDLLHGDRRGFTRSAQELSLAEIVYELFENAHQHGCRDSENAVTNPGCSSSGSTTYLCTARRTSSELEMFLRRDAAAICLRS
jgi:hypothetical protein